MSDKLRMDESYSIESQEARKRVLGYLISWNLQLKENEQISASKLVQRKNSERKEVRLFKFKFVSLGEGPLVFWPKGTHNSNNPLQLRSNAAIQFAVGSARPPSGQSARNTQVDLNVRFTYQDDDDVNPQRYVVSVTRDGNQVAEEVSSDISTAFSGLRDSIPDFNLPIPKNTNLYRILNSHEVQAVFQLFSADGFSVSFLLETIWLCLKVRAEAERNADGNYTIIVSSHIYDEKSKQWLSGSEVWVSGQDGRRHPIEVLSATFEEALFCYCNATNFDDPGKLRRSFETQVLDTFSLRSGAAAALPNEDIGHADFGNPNQAQEFQDYLDHGGWEDADWES